MRQRLWTYLHPRETARPHNPELHQVRQRQQVNEIRLRQLEEEVAWRREWERGEHVDAT